MPVGDIHSDAPGSGARYNDGKPNLALIPLHLLEGTARVFMYGARKYAAWNWAKGMKWSVPIACMKRHIAAFERGETVDPETGESHIAHVICNALMLEHYQTAYREGDDRPWRWFAPINTPIPPDYDPEDVAFTPDDRPIGWFRNEDELEIADPMSDESDTPEEEDQPHPAGIGDVPHASVVHDREESTSCGQLSGLDGFIEWWQRVVHGDVEFRVENSLSASAPSAQVIAHSEGAGDYGDPIAPRGAP